MQFIPYPHADENTKLRHKVKSHSCTCCSTKSTLLRFDGAAVICSKSSRLRRLPATSIVFLFFHFSVCVSESLHPFVKGHNLLRDDRFPSQLVFYPIKKLNCFLAYSIGQKHLSALNWLCELN
nr:AlNc14C98G5945 [Albugo laibachii Nc14]|eukprot:CCA20594.1 AlNc14C98G5945 [Albugo laibachii Nc14]